MNKSTFNWQWFKFSYFVFTVLCICTIMSLSYMYSLFKCVWNKIIWKAKMLWNTIHHNNIIIKVFIFCWFYIYHPLPYYAGWVFTHLNLFVCVCVFWCDFVYIPDDFNMGHGPHPGHIYGHANVQSWNPQQSLRSVCLKFTQISANAIEDTFFTLQNYLTVGVKFSVLQPAVIQNLYTVWWNVQIMNDDIC